jgi:ubiquinone/menaquinone biosynthesis C-methylase UbiE
MTMTERGISFDDGAGYERFMGRASRAAGAIFLDWLAPPAQARWLDIGCGTGAFTQLIADSCGPAALSAVDPAVAQIDFALSQPTARYADFRVADAEHLPFPDQSFDVVVSALVINFVPDRHRALAEMRRVARQRGVVAAYIWDLAGERGPSWPLVMGMREIGVSAPRIVGANASSLEALRSLFEKSGCEEVALRAIDITTHFSSFDDFWQSQTWPLAVNGQVIAALEPKERARLAAAVQAIVPTRSDGSIAVSARANAIKAQAPG